MHIKPIETIYNGYRFRSRLEARWAVFFDTLGIKYEYEPEGFDLGNGLLYLPDFYIPSWDTWIEIKPRPLSDDEAAKCRWLCIDADARYIIALCGNIWPYEHTISLWVKHKGFVSEYEPCHGTFCQCRKCGLIWMKVTDWATECSPNCQCMTYPFDVIASPLVKTAYTAARQARFEHGETPHTNEE